MISIFKNQFDTLHIKQRFTIKKLSIGVVSVLVGFTFCGLNGQSVSADSTLETDSTSTVVSANPTVDEKEYTSIPVSDIKGNARSVSVTSEIDSTSFNDSTNVIKLDTKDEAVVEIQPDGSTDGATIPVIIANKTQAETNNPVGKKLTITVNGKLPDASDLIQNIPSMPEGTKYSYKEQIDTTTTGKKNVVVVVTYPDGSSDEVSVQLTVQLAVQSYAEIYEPIGQNQTIKVGVEPDPRELIANSIAMPEGTKYSYKVPIDTKTPGVKQVVVVVTYPDGSSDEVNVQLTVQSYAETYNPIGQNQTVKIGVEPDPRELIANSIAMPEGTKYSYKVPIDTKTPGKKNVIVVVTYPDGSSDEVNVQLTVQSYAETYNPIGQNQTVKIGVEPDPRELIANSIALPEGTKYSYKVPIDTKTPGIKNVVVVVTYTDGSSDEVNVQLTVQSYAETYNPIGQNQTVKIGVEPDPRELIANSIAMPEGTKYSYKVPIDTKTPGVKQVVVVVTYPDGSSDEVNVQLTVQSYAETYNPIGQNQTVKIGVEPDPRELIANSIAMPEGTKYSYKVPIDTKTPGIKNVIVVVTYPDGSSDEVNVQLTVQSYAETYNPIGQNQTVKIGVEPDPRELIANSIALPEGTKYSYKVPIDTKTPGIKNVVVVVTYTDGSSDEVSVQLTVQSYAETYNPIGQDQTVKIGVEPDPRELIANSIAMPEGTKYSYKEQIDTKTPGVKQVIVVVTYPDGSSDEVSVQLTVQSHAGTYNPIGQDQTVKLGANPDPRELIANSIALPEGTNYSYKGQIDTTTPGVKRVVVVVTYPDGSSDEVSVQLTVQSHTETQEPIGQDQTVKLGANPDPRELIANSIALPEGTTYQYKTPIDTTTPGVKQVIVVVTYPDGSSDEVSVQLTVQSHAGTYNPIGQDQTVKLGANPDPRELIANSIALPEGTKYSYKEQIDTKTPGVKRVIVVVTYPDGSSDEVSVQLTVQSYAETYNPIGQDQTVKLGANPDPRELIANSIALPEGTTYQYKTPIDTTTPGVKQVIVVVTYPDGSSDEVSVQLTVQSHAGTYNPIGQDQTVKLGANPDPRELIANSIALPEGTNYSYKGQIDTTTPGVKRVVVVVTYPDGSSDEVSVQLTVQSHTETQEPIGQDQTVKLGANPDPRELIANSIALPEGTTYQYKTPIDTTTPGVKQVIVVVTYPDGSSDEVSVQLTVQSHAGTYNPIGQDQTVKLGANPDPRELIANSIALPEGTKYSYKEQIDTKTPGVKRVIVVVTYPDGSSDEVSVQLTVQSYAETYNPIGQDQTVKLGANPDPRELIANSIAMPEGTKYSYKEQIDTKTPGKKNVIVVVTYPDGSSDEVNVQLTVQSYAETYNPIGQNQTVKLGVEPDPRELIANSIALPEGTKYSYKVPIDTKTPGKKNVIVVVTYPDGSSDEVNVQLTVQSYAETYNPIGQNQTVKLGVEPDPRELIANSIAMPEGTKYSYKEQIDTKTPGVKQVVVVVTYPDGSSDEVSVQLTVQSYAETYNPIGQDQTVKLGVEPDPRELIANSIALPEGTKYSYKVPIDTKTPGVKRVIVVVTYPDGSSDEVSVQLTVQSYAETYNPIGQDQTVKLGANPDPRELIANSIAMPEGTKYSYKEQIDTKTPGVKQVVVVVTYPDGSSDEVSVQLTVQSYAETYNPIGQDQTVKIGVEPDPRELIANSIAMPEGTKYSYKVPIDTKTPGKKNVIVVVTYPDGSSDEVNVQLTVQSYAETYNPIGQNQTVKLGANPDPRELIANSIALPEGTNYSYKEQIDTTTPGVKRVVVVVTYSDGSSDEVSVQLTVQSYAETYNPIGQDQTVKIGVEPDPRELIANSIALPEGTKYSYKEQIDTKTPGVKQVVVVVTYPDGSSDEVSVQLTVQSYAETYNPIGQDQTVKLGVEPDPRELIANSIALPEGTTYQYKTPIDTTTPGVKQVSVVVTYPDGSSDEVSVQLTVQSHAETQEPIGQDQTVKVGEIPNASDCITNFTDLPDGIRAEFKAPVDTSVPGIKEATVIITYPDGSTAEVTVTVIVKANPTQAEMNKPLGQNQTVQTGKLPNASDCVTNFTDLPDGIRAEFKAPVDTSVPGIKEATVIITYPDGSTAEVTVTVIVKANPTQAEMNTPNQPILKDESSISNISNCSVQTTNMKGKSLDNKSVVANNQTTDLPSTGTNKHNSNSVFRILSIATLVGLSMAKIRRNKAQF